VHTLHNDGESEVSHASRQAIQQLEQATAVVITAYVGAGADKTQYSELLDDTVQSYVREVGEPAAVCLSVDGPGIAAGIAQEIAARYGTSLVMSDRNRGKLAAVQQGILYLLQNPDYRYFAAVDQDGDHFGNDLLNFVRAAEHVRSSCGNDRVVVSGERPSRHRPLGFLRGEQEMLADAILMDALQYYAAMSGKPLNLVYMRPLDRYPDFHAGFKLFSRPTAEDVFGSPPEFAGCTQDAYYRHAIEAVMIVESLVNGAILATVNRRTFDEQPVSVFASFNLTQLTANLILWPCKRLGVPGAFVQQWLDNHLPELLLGTIQPEGREELLAIRSLVIEGYGLPTASYQDKDIPRPRFL
jgi:hypothetical protein